MQVGDFIREKIAEKGLTASQIYKRGGPAVNSTSWILRKGEPQAVHILRFWGAKVLTDEECVDALLMLGEGPPPELTDLYVQRRSKGKSKASSGRDSAAPQREREGAVVGAGS